MMYGSWVSPGPGSRTVRSINHRNQGVERMKSLAKVFAAALLAASVTQPVAAQMTLGFKLGPTFSKLSTSDETEEIDRLSSLGVGGFIRFGMGGLAIQPEVLAVTKGAKFEELGGSGKLKLNYIEVPVQAAFTFGTGTIAPYVLVGPSFSFEIGCEFEFELNGTEVDSECDDSESGEEFSRKKFDIGLTGTAGLSMRLGPGSVLAEFRYTHGLSNLNDDDTNDETTRNR